MLLEIIIKIFFAFVIFCGTTICGIPLIFRFIHNARLLTKIILSFVVGFIVLSLSGIAANALSIDVFTTELCILILCIVGVISLWYIPTVELDRNDRIVLVLAGFYTVVLIAFFDGIVMWMAGDAVAHASIIRMLIDGTTVPASIYPFGTYWDYYPKAFHFYSFFWAKGSSVLSVIQVIPVLISAVTPVILYSVLRELKQETVAVYAFVFACVCFPAHYAYLIWAGYPSIAAEMILIAAILSLVVNWRLLPIFFIGLLFTHTRFVGYLMLILLLYVLYLFYESYKNKLNITLKTVFATLFTALFGFFAICLFLQLIHPPDFLLSLVSDRTLTMEYMSRWFWAILALFGLVIALLKKERAYQIFILWFIAVFTLLFLVDTGILNFFEAPDRIISLLYIPFSVFAAIVLGTISDLIPKSKTVFLGLLILIGLLGMGAIFYNYAGSWGLPKEDYNAIMWLNDQNFQNTICINLDGPGEWVYPLTGIETSYSRIRPKDKLGDEMFMRNLISDPENNSSISAMKNSGYSSILVYISNVSISKPGYIPPFSVNGWGFGYILHPEKFNKGNYDLVYDNGIRLFKFKNG